MLDDPKDLPNHSSSGLSTYLSSFLGGKEVGMEAREYLPPSLTFRPPAEEKEAGLMSENWSHRSLAFKDP